MGSIRYQISTPDKSGIIINNYILEGKIMSASHEMKKYMRLMESVNKYGEQRPSKKGPVRPAPTPIPSSIKSPRPSRPAPTPIPSSIKSPRPSRPAPTSNENKKPKVYRNTDGSATVVLESGDAFWFDNKFVQNYMLNENSKIDRNLISEAVYGMNGNQAGNLFRPEGDQARWELAQKIKDRRAANRGLKRRAEQNASPDAFGRVDPHSQAIKDKIPNAYGADSVQWSKDGLQGGDPRDSTPLALTTKKPLDKQVSPKTIVGRVEPNHGGNLPPKNKREENPDGSYTDIHAYGREQRKRSRG